MGDDQQKAMDRIENWLKQIKNNLKNIEERLNGQLDGIENQDTSGPVGGTTGLLLRSSGLGESPAIQPDLL